MSSADAASADEVRRSRGEREVHDERHMSDMEALMWNLDKDPFLSSTFGSLTILDRVPDRILFRERLLGMVVAVPQLRRRVVPVLGRVAPPEWREDPEFDIDRHLRFRALSGPTDERALLDLAAEIVADPLDRTRPLWEFTVVEGLEGGGAALIQRMHHTVTDGVGGVRMSEQFVDLERKVPPRPPVVVPEPDPAAAAGADGDLVHAAGATVGHLTRRGVGIAVRGAENLAGAVLHPERLVSGGGQVVDGARAVLGQLTVTDHARSPVWVERSLRRRLDILDVSFDDAHEAARAMGGSLNDLFVAAVAGGAGAYHRRRGLPVDDLRMAMPVSVRQDRTAAGNAFVPTRVLIPVGDMDPRERFAAVHDVLGRVKGDRTTQALGAVAGLANLLPTSLTARLTRQQVQAVDFATSNVRAAPFPLFIAGARIEGTYALGPIVGTAFNITMMSYDGSLQIGLHSDAVAVSDPGELRDDIAVAFEELIASGR